MVVYQPGDRVRNGGHANILVALTDWSTFILDWHCFVDAILTPNTCPYHAIRQSTPQGHQVNAKDCWTGQPGERK